jgi:DNA repair protein RecO (recombination protein O)
MSEIVKTEALVLSKLNYGDTSSIAALYTKEFGKLSAILKGGRNPRSKMGLVVDPLNLLQLVLYKKDTREIQLISSADIISHFSRIKEDYNKLKYSQAILELVKKLTLDHEANEKLFRGIIRILNLMETSNETDEILFARFFMFFLKETGFELQFEKCNICGKTNLENSELSYNMELGVLCNNCRNQYLESFRINAELFDFLICLKHSKLTKKINIMVAERSITFMEKYLMFHFPEFKGIQSLQLFK